MDNQSFYNTTEELTESKYDIELPQSIVESYARFLIPEMRKFYESEQGKQILAELQTAGETTNN